MLMARESESGPPQLWSISTDGGEPQPSGLAIAGDGYGLGVHPDGRRIVYHSSQGPTEEVWVIKNLLSTPKAPR
jgi:Tol biopolymer transport system component